MKMSHLDAMAQVKGFEGFKDFLEIRWLKDKRPLDEIADELEVSQSYLRKMIIAAGVGKPIKEIPLSIQDARRLTVDAIAKKLSVPRSTAWRWRQTILSRAADAEEGGVIDALVSASKSRSAD